MPGHDKLTTLYPEIASLDPRIGIDAETRIGITRSGSTPHFGISLEMSWAD